MHMKTLNVLNVKAEAENGKHGQRLSSKYPQAQTVVVCAANSFQSGSGQTLSSSLVFVAHNVTPTCTSSCSSLPSVRVQIAGAPRVGDGLKTRATINSISPRQSHPKRSRAGRRQDHDVWQ